MCDEGWCGSGLGKDITLDELGTVGTVLEVVLEVVGCDFAFEVELGCLESTGRDS